MTPDGNKSRYAIAAREKEWFGGGKALRCPSARFIENIGCRVSAKNLCYLAGGEIRYPPGRVSVASDAFAAVGSFAPVGLRRWTIFAGLSWLPNTSMYPAFGLRR
jgi:hypothetical protein